MTIDEFIAALARAAPQFKWRLEDGFGDEHRKVLRARLLGEPMVFEPFGVVCEATGKGRYDVGAYATAANKLDLHWRAARSISFAYNESPYMDSTLRGRILSQIDL